MKKTLTAVALAGACASPACVHEPTAVQRAAEVAKLQCVDPSSSDYETRVIRATTVLRADPITFPAGAATVSEGGGTTQGLRLLVRVPEGVTTEQLKGILMCHSARALIGEAGSLAFPNDPFCLPNTYVYFEVKSRGGSFMDVDVSADRIWQNLALVKHASAFVEAQRQAFSSQ